MEVWKLNYPKDSIDGQPLVTSIADLLWNIHLFPYHRLPLTTGSSSDHSASSAATGTGSQSLFITWYLRPEFVIGLLFFYVFVSKQFVKYLRTNIFHWDQMDSRNNNSNNNSKNVVSILIQSTYTCFQYFVIIHNAILAIFSAICAYNTIGIIINHTYTYGFYSTYCDPNNTFWNDYGFGSWAIVFYISKYYEFVDTWILLFKGKNASFLQVYHHTGIVYIMYCAVLSQSAWLLFVVSLNAIIHTFMYTYFCIKSISPTTELSIAKYLTMAQIGQFFTGIICTIPIFVYGEQCDTSSSRFALACLHTYGFGLIALFVTFAQKKYTKKDI